MFKQLLLQYFVKFCLFTTQPCCNWSPNYSVLVSLFHAIYSVEQRGSDNHKGVFYMRYSISSPKAPRCGNTVDLANVLTSKSNPDRPPSNAQSVQPQCLHGPRLLQFFIQLYNAITVLESVSPDAGLQKGSHFSTLIVGLARDRTRVSCATLSGGAIHYDISLYLLS
jgi:hypothetical protein